MIVILSWSRSEIFCSSALIGASSTFAGIRPIWRKAPVAWSRYCIGDFTMTDDDTGSLLRGAI